MNANSTARGPRWLVAALLVLSLVAHLPFLAPSLEDIDSANLALGVREFDVARHQPHPPGYPIFVGLAKLTTPLARAWTPADAPSTQAEARGLAIWAALLGALAALPLFLFYRALDGHAWRAALATAVALANPLAWVTAVRPLSDIPGLAATLAALALLGGAFATQHGIARSTTGYGIDRDALARSGRLLVLGALVAGLAIGVRSQSLWITLPLLLLVLVDRAGRDVGGAVVGATITFSIGVLLWLVPLVLASGGPGAYIAAFTAQAGEDIEGVDLLATHPTPRRLALALLHTFVFPWVSTPLAAVVLVAAVVGAGACLFAGRRALMVLVAVGVPYGVFHLFLQDTHETRYAIPVIVPIAWLAVRGLFVAGRLAASVGAAGIVAASLAVAVPAVVAYGREGGPAFRAVDDVMAARARRGGAEAPAIAMHHALARVVRGEEIAQGALPAPPGREWAGVVDHWIGGARAPVWYLVEPRRTDRALFDPHAVRTRGVYRWPFDQPTLAGGARPQSIDWLEIDEPGWLATDGWSLTPELAGAAERQQRGPSRGGSTAWVRRRAEPVWMLVGGRNLGSSGEPDVRFTLSLDDRPIKQWSAPPDPGFFLEAIELPAGALSGDGYAKLTIEAEAADGSGRPVRAAVEQFDLQPVSRPVFAAGEGWHEGEYAPGTGLSWRWTSDSAALRVLAPADVPLELSLRGESPLKYFDRAPVVRVSACEVEVGRFTPSANFDEQVPIPAGAVAACGGHLTVATDLTFVPDERTGNGDRRRLGLRIYDVTVRAGSGNR